MSRASRIASTIARQIGRQAAQRYLPQPSLPGDDALDEYLKGLRRWAERTGYSVDRGHCFWCGRRSKLKVGRLPHVGALLYCPVHEPVYRGLKEGRDNGSEPGQGTEGTHKVHMRSEDAWTLGEPLCGVASDVRPLVTSDPQQVTCLRCRKIMST